MKKRIIATIWGISIIIPTTVAYAYAHGSGHTTLETPDPWEWLYIQVSDLN